MTSLSPFAEQTLSPRFRTPEQEDVGPGQAQYARKGVGDDGLYVTPPTSRHQSDEQRCEEDEDLVYLDVDVDLAKMRDWREKVEDRAGDDDQEEQSRGELVTVNNTEIAVFRFGDNVLATQARCPHAGGPLHLGDIEVLPDRSVCVRCPWHRWSFCVARKKPGSELFTRRKLFTEESRGQGECVWPPGRGEEGAGVKVYPAIVDKKRKSVKIGFENFSEKTLFKSEF